MDLKAIWMGIESLAHTGNRYPACLTPVASHYTCIGNMQNYSFTYSNFKVFIHLSVLLTLLHAYTFSGFMVGID